MRLVLTVFCAVLSFCFVVRAAENRGVTIRVKDDKGGTTPIQLYSASYALVVGNSQYRHWDPLPGAAKDVGEVATALFRNGFDVTVKTDLTKDDFERVFRDFVAIRGTDRMNRLLFYYAGHGHTERLANDEDLGYLVMIDAPTPENDLAGFASRSVDMQWIVTQAKRIQSTHVLFMFDSCFSGSILNLRSRVVPESVAESMRNPVRQFITAGCANEPVPDRSYFKQCFLDILQKRDKEPIADGYLTGEELGYYLKNKVPEYNRRQHPQYGKIADPKLDKGDFVFDLASAKSEETDSVLLPAPAPRLVQPPLEVVHNYYTIVPNDTLGLIAKKCGLRPEDLLEMNPGLDRRRMKVGSNILIRIPTTTNAATPSIAPPVDRPKALLVHEVQSNESLVKIAMMYGVSVEAVRKANGMRNDTVRVGQRLVIP